MRLETHWTQRQLVAPMEWSFADALIPRSTTVRRWCMDEGRDGDDELVGFVMLALVTAAHPEPYLWRLLVDRLHQRRGIGRRVLDLIVEECETRGWSTLTTSWDPRRGTPELFYLSYGFVPTGEIEDDEIVARLTFG